MQVVDGLQPKVMQRYPVFTYTSVGYKEKSMLKSFIGFFGMMVFLFITTPAHACTVQRESDGLIVGSVNNGTIQYADGSIAGSVGAGGSVQSSLLGGVIVGHVGSNGTLQANDTRIVGHVGAGGTIISSGNVIVGEVTGGCSTIDKGGAALLLLLL